MKSASRILEGWAVCEGLVEQRKGIGWRVCWLAGPTKKAPAVTPPGPSDGWRHASRARGAYPDRGYGAMSGVTEWKSLS